MQKKICYLTIDSTKLKTNLPRLRELQKTYGVLLFHQILNKHAFLGSYIKLFILVIKLSYGFDLVIVRYPSLPIVSLVPLFFIPNLAVEHHGILEYEKLHPPKNIKYYFHLVSIYMFKKLSQRRKTINISFTDQITSFLQDTYKIKIDNIISTSNSNSKPFANHLIDKRSQNTFNLVFLCGKFHPWQGLDKIIPFLQEVSKSLNIHLTLVGLIEDKDRIQKLNWISHYDHLNSDDLDMLMQKMDVGIGPCALDRQGLIESCSLKVSYYLSRGIPSFSFYPDSRQIPYPAYLYLDQFAPNRKEVFIKFLINSKQASRESIYLKTEKLWSHDSVLSSLMEQINNIK